MQNNSSYKQSSTNKLIAIVLLTLVILVAPLALILKDAGLLKAAYFVNKQNSYAKAEIINSSYYQADLERLTKGGAYHNIKYQFNVPGTTSIYTGKDRLIATAKGGFPAKYHTNGNVRGTVLVKYYPKNPNYNQLAKPYYSKSRIVAVIVLLTLCFITFYGVAYYIIRQRTFRYYRWIVGLSFAGILLTAFLIAYII